jgi:hypothetical protein
MAVIVDRSEHIGERTIRAADRRSDRSEERASKSGR